MRRPLEFHRFFEDCGMPLELFCYTEEEAASNRLARRALERGVPLASEES